MSTTRKTARRLNLARSARLIAALALVAFCMAGCKEKPQAAAPATSAATPAAFSRTQHTSSGEASLDVTTTLDKTTLTVADRVDLRLDIRTRAAASLTLPTIDQTLGDFTVVSSETTEDSPPGAHATHIHLVLEPFLSGDKTIAPLEIQAKDGAARLTIKTDPISLRVAPVASVDASEKTPLEPAKAPVALIVQTPRDQRKTILWLGIFAAFLAVATALGAVAYSRFARGDENPTIRVRRAFETLRTSLAQATTPAQADVACEELHRRFTEYLRAAWNIPADTQTAAQLIPALSIFPSLTPGARDELAQLLTDMERARFAPDAATVPIVQSLLDRCSTFVDRLTASAKEAA